MKYTFLLVFCSLFNATAAHAQYAGGSNDGMASLNTKNLHNQLPGIYSGGANDGHARHQAAVQNSLPGIYLGGSNDGVTTLQAKDRQNKIPDIYAGGGDDGFSAVGSRIQNAQPDIYFGGMNDGVSTSQALSMNTIPPIYLGGTNDGVSVSIPRGTQNNLPGIYAGGSEDGHAISISIGQNSSEPPIRNNHRTAPMLQLTGVWFNEDAVLGWKIEAAGEMDFFELQRSQDGGVSYTDIVRIDRNAEAGQDDYRFADVRAYHLGGEYLLYRLKCVQLSGEYSYSAVVKLGRDKTAPVIVAYPNPTSGRFTLAIMNSPELSGYSYVLTAVDGRIIRRGTMQESSTSFDLSGYASATYHLFIFRDGKTVQHFNILLTQ